MPKLDPFSLPVTEMLQTRINTMFLQVYGISFCVCCGGLVRIKDNGRTEAMSHLQQRDLRLRLANLLMRWREFPPPYIKEKHSTISPINLQTALYLFLQMRYNKKKTSKARKCNESKKHIVCADGLCEPSAL